MKPFAGEYGNGNGLNETERNRGMGPFMPDENGYASAPRTNKLKSSEVDSLGGFRVGDLINHPIFEEPIVIERLEERDSLGRSFIFYTNDKSHSFVSLEGITLLGRPSLSYCVEDVVQIGEYGVFGDVLAIDPYTEKYYVQLPIGQGNEEKNNEPWFPLHLRDHTVDGDWFSQNEIKGQYLLNKKKREKYLDVENVDGNTIRVDTSNEACKKFGFQYGDIIKDPVGDIGIFVGVAPHPGWNDVDYFWYTEGISGSMVCVWNDDDPFWDIDDFVLVHRFEESASIESSGEPMEEVLGDGFIKTNTEFLVVFQMLLKKLEQEQENGNSIIFPPDSFKLLGNGRIKFEKDFVFEVEAVDDLAEHQVIKKLGATMYHLVTGESEWNHMSYLLGYTEPINLSFWPLLDDMLNEKFDSVDDVKKDLKDFDVEIVDDPEVVENDQKIHALTQELSDLLEKRSEMDKRIEEIRKILK